MPLFFADLVREYSSSTGAGDFVLAGAVPGCRAFAGVVPVGARFHYCIAGLTQPHEWETGAGVIGSGGALVRAPFASSAGGGLVAFSAGLKTVALTVAAEWFAEQEEDVAVEDVGGLQAALDGKAAADHLHAGIYAPAGHHHDAAYAAAGHDHGADYAAAGHDHGGAYAVVGHDHDAVYAPAGHDHDAAYAALGHHHDGVYAAAGHHHDGSYAAFGHHHDGAYAALGHDHDGAYQPLDGELSAIAGLASAADRLAYFTGPGAAALTGLSGFGRGLIDDADAAAGRGTLGLGSAAVRNVGQAGDAVPLCSAGVTFGGTVGGTGLACSGANVQSSIVDTSIAGTLPMIHVRRAAGNANAEVIRLEAYGNAAAARGVRIAFHTPNAGSSLFQGSVGASGAGPGVEIRGPANGVVARVNDAGIDVLGELRGDALRIDAAPAAGSAAATHKLPVSLNGVTYFLLLSSS